MYSFFFTTLIIQPDRINKFFINGYLYYFIILINTLNYLVFSRMSLYFELFSIILIPNFIFHLKKSKYLITVIILSAYFLVFWKMLYDGGVEPWRIIPYRTVLF
ncbi:EpsG family protein [Halanaerobium salsuginis]|uniref:EpsG family protein n=1 Tax=Halanaerobium salsuginis TaxID=29563 RepID=UPI003CCBDE1B